MRKLKSRLAQKLKILKAAWNNSFRFKLLFLELILVGLSCSRACRVKLLLTQSANGHNPID